MALKDFLGRLVRRQDLAKEVAAPALTGPRSIRPDSVWSGMTPEILAAVLRAAEAGDTRRYYALAEQLLERDSHAAAVINTRIRQVVQLDITVEPADDSAVAAKHAALIEQFLAREELIEELFDLQDAIAKGVSILEIDWDVGATPLLPKRLIWRDPRGFMWDKETLSRLQLRDEAGQGQELPAWKFVIHRHQAKSGIAARDGLARQCAFLSLFKSLTIKGWVSFCETYGQPYRIGKYGTGAMPEDRETLLDAVLSIAADAGAIIPESMQIEFVETNVSGSAQAFEALARYANQEISKLVLGQTTTTEAISGGHAVSREHNEVREDIERADARALAATLKRDLIIPIIALNFGEQQAYPSLRIGRPEALDIQALVDAVAKLVPLGFGVPEDYLRRRLYVPEPEVGKPVLQPAPAPMLPSADAKAAALGSHDARAAQAADPVDTLIERLWTAGALAEAFAPVIGPIEAAIAEAGSLEALRERLAGLIDTMDPDRFAELLARADFFGRLAGETEKRG